MNLLFVITIFNTNFTLKQRSGGTVTLIINTLKSMNSTQNIDMRVSLFYGVLAEPLGIKYLIINIWSLLNIIYLKKYFARSKLNPPWWKYNLMVGNTSRSNFLISTQWKQHPLTDKNIYKIYSIGVTCFVEALLSVKWTCLCICSSCDYEM